MLLSIHAPAIFYIQCYNYSTGGYHNAIAAPCQCSLLQESQKKMLCPNEFNPLAYSFGPMHATNQAKWDCHWVCMTGPKHPASGLNRLTFIQDEFRIMRIAA